MHLGTDHQTLRGDSKEGSGGPKQTHSIITLLYSLSYGSLGPVATTLSPTLST